jgi:hypothetical protein
MVLPVNSQNISKPEVVISISNKKDTLLCFKINDARKILKDILNAQTLDSLLLEYQKKDSLSTVFIKIQKETIDLLLLKEANNEQKIIAFQQIIENKNAQIITKDQTIKSQEKSIKKYKNLTKIGFSLAIILPVIILFFK